MVIAIDGPAGAGKSTVARAVAERLGFTYLDTGAMYRCVALAADERGGEPAAVAEASEIELGDRVLLDGRDVTEAIRTPAVSRGVLAGQRRPRGARGARAQAARAAAARATGSPRAATSAPSSCPDAEVKVFLTASPEVRARRRAEELGADCETVLAEQLERDARDSEREHSPLVAGQRRGAGRHDRPRPRAAWSTRSSRWSSRPREVEA